MKIFYSLIIVLFFLYSCKNDTYLEANDYVSFIENENNTFLNEKKIDDLFFKIQYCPTEYLLIKERKGHYISKELLDEKKKENEGLLFFKLRIKSVDNSDVLNYNLRSNEEYYQRIDYLSYGFEEDIVLVNGTDTIFPGIFLFERTYGISPNADFMIAFDTKIKKDDEFQVVIDDKLFNTGLIKFNFLEKDIKNVPLLKTN